MITVGFVSLGCAKNLVDSQVMAGLLHERKIKIVPTEEAQVIIVNTCAFIESAREEAAEAILGVCELKRQGACRAVVVTGCLPQRYQKKLRDVFPDVDAFLGIDELEKITAVTEAVAAGKKPKMTIAASGPVKTYSPKYPSLLFTGGPFGYLKIGDGCNHRCAYCAIPLIRGSYRSRPLNEIVAEAEGLVRAGVKELNVISQDTLMYRDGKTGICGLLKKLAALKGDFRIRLLYGYPGGVTDELLELLGSDPKFCRYLDLPIQHAHPEILRAMNRADIADSVRTLPERLRAVLPDVTIRTTCLLGFPGETNEQFKTLENFVREARFDHLGVFAYSPEEGTTAFEMDNVPSVKTAEKRCARIMELQKEIAAELNQARIGQKGRALLLTPAGKGKWTARLDHQAPDVDGVTTVKGVPETVRSGDLVSVVITGSSGFDLSARIV